MNPKLEKYIATRDRRMKDPLSSTPLKKKFDELIQWGKIEVGGRASCGGKPDPTWTMFCAWNEIIKKAKTLGYQISIDMINHPNKSPTMAGGFWNSNIYTLLKNAP